MTLEDRVRRCLLAGDARGAATLAVEELGPTLLRYLRSAELDEDDAADAFAETAERLWRGLAEFRGGSSLRTWSLRIAWNVVRDRRKAAWRRLGRRFSRGEASALADDLRTRTAQRVERQRQAVEALRRALGPEDRSLLALRVDQELPWEEVSQILGRDGKPVSVPALQKRFERVKDRLARMARERGLLD